MPQPPRNRLGSVFQYQTFDNNAFNYQTFDWGSLRVSNHPIPPPKNIRFTKYDDADDSEKSGDEAGDSAKDKDTTPASPEIEPVEVLSLDEPENPDRKCYYIYCELY